MHCQAQASARRLAMPIKITGLILAGGLGRRMGNADKGLATFNSQPMIASVIARFKPQVDELLINANRNIDTYETFGYRVIGDAIEGFAGPLAGLERGLAEAAHELVATSPCDSPFLPDDLVARLSAAMADAATDLAVAKTGTQPHPVFCLVRQSVHSHLRDFLTAGGRKIDAWYATLNTIEVAFDDQANAFANINTTDELSRLEQFR
jgi:molybdenum cofactor guanylyltransferase